MTARSTNGRARKIGDRVLIEERLLVEDPVPAANRRCAVAANVPGEADPRRELRPGRVEEQRIADRDLRIHDVAQVRHLPVAFVGRRNELVAEAGVHRQLVRDPDVILQPRPEEMLAVMPLEVGAGLGDLELLRDAGQEIGHAPEPQAAARAALGIAVVPEVLPVDTGLDRMASGHDQQLVGELVEVLREPLRVRPVCPDLGQSGDRQLAECLARHERQVIARIERIDVFARARSVEPDARLVDDGRGENLALLDREHVLGVEALVRPLCKIDRLVTLGVVEQVTCEQRAVLREHVIHAGHREVLVRLPVQHPAILGQAGRAAGGIADQVAVGDRVERNERLDRAPGTAIGARPGRMPRRALSSSTVATCVMPLCSRSPS